MASSHRRRGRKRRQQALRERIRLFSWLKLQLQRDLPKRGPPRRWLFSVRATTLHLDSSPLDRGHREEGRHAATGLGSVGRLASRPYWDQDEDRLASGVLFVGFFQVFN